MAQQTKTVRVPLNFGNVADVADNVNTVIGTTTIYTPEASSTNNISFVSVMAFYAWQSTASNASINSFATTFTISGATGSSTSTISGTLAQTGEEITGIIGPVDFTQYFTNNYPLSATSRDVTVRVQIDVSAGVSRGVYNYIEYTYKYEETSPTQIQTICIPFENSGSLATTQTTVETLPQLTGTGGLLKGYSDLVIRDRWIQLKGNSNTNNATNDITLTFSFDGLSGTNLPIREEGGGSDGWSEYQIDSSSLTTTTGHTFQLWSNVATRFTNIIINEWITYEFTTSGTTEVVNYFEYPVEFNWPLKLTSSEFSRYGRIINLPEPIGPSPATDLIMENCAVELIYNTNASATAQIRVGTQSFAAYAMAATQVTGCFGFQHRFDSGSASGSGVTLTRGSNIIDVDLYESVGNMTNISGSVKLLYRSGVSSLGIPTHSRTVTKINLGIDFTAKEGFSNDNVFDFLTSNYWIHGIGYQGHVFTQTTGMFTGLKVEIFSGEFDGAGYVQAYSDWYLSDNEVAYTYWNVCVCPFTKLYPQEPDNLIDVAVSREYYSVSTTNNREGSKLFISYHNITFTLSGDVTGSSGGVINLDLFKENSDNELELFSTSTITGNTSYSFVIYDDTATYQVTAYESSTKKGISIKDIYSGNFDINLSPGGEYGYGLV